VAVAAQLGDALGHVPGPLRRAQLRMKALGMHQRHVVFELHVRQGRSLQQVAVVLGLSYATVWGHWQHVLEDMVVHAPQDVKTLTATREQIAARLWATVEDTYLRAELSEEGELLEVELPATPPLLSVRLKALDQIAKLYGLGLERCEGAEGVPPYAMPEEIAATVRARVLALHGREGLVAGVSEKG
jgi:DNA-binding CsgD family transcriptional regulator